MISALSHGTVVLPRRYGEVDSFTLEWRKSTIAGMNIRFQPLPRGVFRGTREIKPLENRDCRVVAWPPTGPPYVLAGAATDHLWPELLCTRAGREGQPVKSFFEFVIGFPIAPTSSPIVCRRRPPRSASIHLHESNWAREGKERRKIGKVRRWRFQQIG